MKELDGRPIPNEVKHLPSYADGYFDALQGEGFDTDRADDEAYAYGYEAGERAGNLFDRHGFRRTSKGFSIKLTTPAAKQDVQL